MIENACMHRLDPGLYSHPKEFWENEVRTHVYSKGKIPTIGEKKSSQKRIEPTTTLHKGQRAQHTTNELFRPLNIVFNIFAPNQTVRSPVASGEVWGRGEGGGAGKGEGM